MEVRMSHESRYTLVRLHDGGETTGECGVSIREYGVYDILHTRPLETTAAFAETQWLTADDVIWKVFFYFHLYSFTAVPSYTSQVYISEISRRCRKKDREKTVCNANILKLLLETNASHILLYRLRADRQQTFHNMMTCRYMTYHSNHMTYTMLYNNIHILIYSINILTDVIQTFIIVSFGLTGVMLTHNSYYSNTHIHFGVPWSRKISGVLVGTTRSPKYVLLGDHSTLSLY